MPTIPQALQFFKLKHLFKKEETRFIMGVGFKVSGISFGVTLFVYYFLFQVGRLNYAFFKSQGFPLDEEGAFFDYILKNNFEEVIILFAFHIFLFFIGNYVGWLMLRPFRTIGEHSELAIGDENTPYKTDEFSNYRLLARFSEYFFEYLRDGRKRGDISPKSISPQYSRIHKPTLDWIFLLHFGLLLVVIAICSAVFIIDSTSSVWEEITDLAMKTLQDPNVVKKFFSKQQFIMEEVVFLSTALISFFYALLGFHLYGMVAGPAFGIFSTMRAFMKGNYFSRVHLVGYAYVREHTRKLNKYLDYVENNLIKKGPKG